MPARFLLAALAFVALAGCSSASAQDRYIEPPAAAKPGTLDAWFKLPNARVFETIPVWIDPNFRSIATRDKHPQGDDAMDAIWTACLNYGRVSGLRFLYVTDPSRARFKIRYGLRSQIGGASGRAWASTGEAVVTTDTPGYGRHYFTTVCLIAQHEIGHLLGWGHDPNPATLMNVGLGHPMRYPAGNYPNWQRYGCAGFGMSEINRLQAKGGPIYWYQEKALTP